MFTCQPLSQLSSHRFFLVYSRFSPCFSSSSGDLPFFPLLRVNFAKRRAAGLYIMYWNNEIKRKEWKLLVLRGRKGLNSRYLYCHILFGFDILSFVSTAFRKASYSVISMALLQVWLLLQCAYVFVHWWSFITFVTKVQQIN